MRMSWYSLPWTKIFQVYAFAEPPQPLPICANVGGWDGSYKGCAWGGCYYCVQYIHAVSVYDWWDTLPNQGIFWAFHLGWRLQVWQFVLWDLHNSCNNTLCIHLPMFCSQNHKRRYNARDFDKSKASNLLKMLKGEHPTKKWQNCGTEVLCVMLMYDGAELARIVDKVLGI